MLNVNNINTNNSNNRAVTLLIDTSQLQKNGLQMVTAALDSGDLATAHEHLEVLRAKFPGSQRVKRLEGMQCEAEGNFSAAAKIYEEMLVANPANSLARKRQVRVCGCGCVVFVCR